MGTTRSGWCLRELTPGSKPEHDKCPKNFTSGVCSCDCDHLGEKPAGWADDGGDTPKRNGAENVDRVYTERVPIEGGVAVFKTLVG